MSTAISLSFPWGRYHATPWDRSVNEGVVEWPPSPWRLLRALYATWATRAPNLERDDVADTLSGISAPPAYLLPTTAVGHSRHYYPDINTGTDKVFDPFVVMRRNAEVVVRWDAALGPRARQCLHRLCELLPYVGRADSICDARLLPENASLPHEGWTAPGIADDLLAPAATVLAAELPLDLQALTTRTTDARKRGHVLPTGSRYVRYPLAVSSTSTPRATPPRAKHDRCEAALLLLDAPALPSIRDAVWVGHVTRQAAIKMFDDYGRHHAAPFVDGPATGTHSEVLVGKAVSGERLQGHRHAHYLPLDLDGDRLLDAVAVWAPDGLGVAELAALGAIRRLWHPHPDFRPARVALTTRGTAAAVLPMTSAGTTWESVTPFVPYRHRKRESLDEFLEDALHREAAARSLPAPRLVSVVKRPWLEFRRSRPGQREQRPGFGLVIEFPAPVAGPLALGTLSHYGLGQFRPLT